MKKYTYRRISAFLIDIMLVTLISTLFSSINYVNPLMNDYEVAYKEYQEVYQKESETLLKETSFKSIDKYCKALGKTMYKLDYTLIFNNLYYLLFYFLYFVVFAYFTNGQTLGKKLFKLKIVDKNNNKVTFKNLIFRSIVNGSTLFMGINIIVIIQLLSLLINNYNIYFYFNMFVTSISFIIDIVILILLIVNKEHRSIDDIMGKTKVVDVNV